MQILVSIDDTDNLESPGTGALASRIAADLERNCWGKSSFVTRHQLLVHPDIPYTSHNSAMCFSAKIEADCLEKVINYAAGFLARESAVGSDPGLCIAVLDHLPQFNELIVYGQTAKTVLLDGKAVLMVVPTDGTADSVRWQTCSRKQPKIY
jgi:hypothetical protein